VFVPCLVAATEHDGVPRLAHRLLDDYLAMVAARCCPARKRFHLPARDKDGPACVISADLVTYLLVCNGRMPLGRAATAGHAEATPRYRLPPNENQRADFPSGRWLLQLPRDHRHSRALEASRPTTSSVMVRNCCTAQSRSPSAVFSRAAYTSK
jgi:hypothetical protein